MEFEKRKWKGTLCASFIVFFVFHDLCQSIFIMVENVIVNLPQICCNFFYWKISKNFLPYLLPVGQSLITNLKDENEKGNFVQLSLWSL